MAYPKITVNTGLALKLIASDTLPIPSPDLPKLSGTTTAVVVSKLVDAAADFSNVSVGDIIYNTTGDTSVSVTAIDSTTILSVSADVFIAAQDYTIYLGGPNGSVRIDSSEGCILYVGSNAAAPTIATSYVDVKVKTVAGSVVTFSNFPVGEYLPIQILQLYATGTDVSSKNNCIAIW